MGTNELVDLGSAPEPMAALERLAEKLVLADVDDPGSLAALHTTVEEFRRSVASSAILVQVCRACAALIEKVILEEVDRPAQEFEKVMAAASLMQEVVRDGRNAAEVAWPLDLQAAGESPAPAAFHHPGNLPAYIDRDIYEEFLIRQKGVMDDLELLILSMEKDGDEETLSAVRRILHTLKGESAMLALQEVEQVCHRTEDVLMQHPPNRLIDPLLAVKDWLTRSFVCYLGGADDPGSAQALLAQLDALAGLTDGVPAPNKLLEADPELLKEFVGEAREHLQAADIHLLTIESDPGNGESINAVFRAFHTIKGVAGFLGLDEILSLAHEAESLLDQARKKEVVLEGPAVDITFDAVDLMKQLVQAVDEFLASGAPPVAHAEVPELIGRLRQMSVAGLGAQEAEELPACAPGQKLGEVLVRAGAALPQQIERAVRRQQEETVRQPLGEILVTQGKVTEEGVAEAIQVQQENPQAGRIGQILVEKGEVREPDVDIALRRQAATEKKPRLGEVLVRANDVPAKHVAQAVRSQRLQAQDPGAAPAPGAFAATTVAEPVRVDAARLDRLVDTIGELVIAESMVSQSQVLRRMQDDDVSRHLRQLDKITRELQEMGTSLRMVPIRNMFQKMARLVRDLAKKSGKAVEFSSEGDDTELDKTVVDKMGDPLVHMIRNAVDHGIESTPALRAAAGKCETGRVQLRAYHKGGSIYIEIEDDGRGLDAQAILAKAREREIVRETDTLTDREIFNLIFLPGFSTAQKVTDVSGRGVGMDVVKRNIEALRGQIEIQSRPGHGTLFSIRLPLTLAIIDGMVVRVGPDRYIIPTLSIVISVRPDTKDLATVAARGEMLKLQGRLVPLFRLARLFHAPQALESATEGTVVVVEDEGRRVGFLVDEIVGQQQIVIKSLGAALQGTPGLAGGAIMPDGTVGLILDVSGLVRLAHADERAAAL